jgi:small subunit ribosomal protein S6
MRKYETVLISDPDLQDQTRSELFDKIRNIITNEKGIILDFDEWGNKKLAYEIKKKSRGHYVCITYGGDGPLVAELERNFRLTDTVLKFMTIVLSGDMTARQLEKEAQELEEQQQLEEKSAEPAAPEETPQDEKAEDTPDAEPSAQEEPQKETE